jgi:hypothetical protein
LEMTSSEAPVFVRRKIDAPPEIEVSVEKLKLYPVPGSTKFSERFDPFHRRYFCYSQ